MNIHDPNVTAPKVTTGALPASRKIYVAPDEAPDLRVPVREIILEASAKDWHRAEILRGFAAAVEAKARQTDGTLPEDKAAWMLRARRIADRVDPLTPNPPSPLDYADADLRPLYGWETLD